MIHRAAVRAWGGFSGRRRPISSYALACGLGQALAGSRRVTRSVRAPGIISARSRDRRSLRAVVGTGVRSGASAASALPGRCSGMREFLTRRWSGAAVLVEKVSRPALVMNPSPLWGGGLGVRKVRTSGRRFHFPWPGRRRGRLGNSSSAPSRWTVSALSAEGPATYAWRLGSSSGSLSLIHFDANSTLTPHPGRCAHPAASPHPPWNGTPRSARDPARPGQEDSEGCRLNTSVRQTEPIPVWTPNQHTEVSVI